MIIVLRYNIPTVIYQLYGRSRITDDGTVTFYTEIKLKMGFDVVHCCYYYKIYLQLIDMGGLRSQRAIQTDIFPSPPIRSGEVFSSVIFFLSFSSFVCVFWM